MENIDARVLILDSNRVLLVLEKKKPVDISGKESFTKQSRWGMPGGRGEPDDKDEIDTALREVKEEIHLPIYVDERRRLEKQADGYIRVLFIGEPGEGIIKINPEEILDCRWFPLGVLYDESFNMYSGHRQMAQELLRKLGK
ncbi:MAG: NUDIX hydrolase [bacterium]|nr:NUDIX hydrolase [bacterium]